MTAAINTQVFEQLIKGAQATAASKTATKPAKAKPAKVAEQKPAKPATKAASTKTAAAKTAAKAAPKVTAKTSIAYGLHDGSRPCAGRYLFAFTHAWLSASGLGEGKAYPKAQAIQVAGSTAISYHSGNGNLENKGGMLTLSSKGLNFFKARVIEGRVDMKLAESYMQALKSGKPDDTIGIKSATAFRKIEA